MSYPTKKKITRYVASTTTSASSSSCKPCQLLKNFNVFKLLGAGGFGAVIQVRNKLDGKDYGIKVVAMDALVGVDVDVSREVKNLAALPQHKNLVLYSTSWEDRLTIFDLGSIKSKCKSAGATSSEMAHLTLPSGSTYLKTLCIQMELCGKDLRHWLEEQTLVKEKECVEIFLQTQSGLRHIHKHNLIHRDLKPENIFFHKINSTSVKIGDFGLAVAHTTMRSAFHSNGRGTTCYAAPEQIISSTATHARYDKMVDIFASGLILLELFYPQMQAIKNNNSFYILEQTFHNLKHGRQVPSSVAKSWPLISNLILKMTESDKKNRPSADDIFETLKSLNSSQSTASAQQSSLPAVIHKDIKCSHCGVKPMVGVRYKCSVCVNFNLCQICEYVTPVVHDDKHGMIKMKSATTSTATTAPLPPPAFQPVPPLGYELIAPPIYQLIQPPLYNDQNTALPTMTYFPPPVSSLNSNQWSTEPLRNALDSYSYSQSYRPRQSSKGNPYCKRCDNDITGRVYKCRICVHFYYCGHCYRSNGSAYDHKQEHDFWKVASGWNPFLYN